MTESEAWPPPTAAPTDCANLTQAECTELRAIAAAAPEVTDWQAINMLMAVVLVIVAVWLRTGGVE